METKGVKEINQYFDDKIKFQEDNKLNVEKKNLNIRGLDLRNYNIIISFYKKTEFSL